MRNPETFGKIRIHQGTFDKKRSMHFNLLSLGWKITLRGLSKALSRVLVQDVCLPCRTPCLRAALAGHGLPRLSGQAPLASLV